MNSLRLSIELHGKMKELEGKCLSLEEQEILNLCEENWDELEKTRNKMIEVIKEINLLINKFNTK